MGVSKFYVAIGLMTLAGYSHGALSVGQSLGVDLGTVAPTNNFNIFSSYIPIPPLPEVPVGSVIDLTGATVPGVSLTFPNYANTSSAALAPTVGAPFNASNSIDYVYSQGVITVVVNGLDDSLLYNVTVLSYSDFWTSSPQDIAVNGQPLAPVVVTSSDNIRVIENLEISGDSITITAFNPAISYGGLINALVIEAVASPVPEPSTGILAALALPVLLRRRR